MEVAKVEGCGNPCGTLAYGAECTHGQGLELAEFAVYAPWLINF